ncbi:MAG: DUF523 domain-containing protein [Clostridiales bacterium]|nr:DUF523 domain-containing protein [Clostridiales bacterium]
MYIVSACLAGVDCRYDGGNNECAWVVEFAKSHACVLVCPESAGGLPKPRPPAEIIAGRAVDRNGKDVTEEFAAGAAAAYEIAESAAKAAGEAIEGAILKAHSPSCGRGVVYDGSFSGKLTEGDGFFAKLLMVKGVAAVTEKEVPKW